MPCGFTDAATGCGQTVDYISMQVLGPWICENRFCVDSEPAGQWTVKK
jgi:hypothetical protein